MYQIASLNASPALSIPQSTGWSPPMGVLRARGTQVVVDPPEQTGWTAQAAGAFILLLLLFSITSKTQDAQSTHATGVTERMKDTLGVLGLNIKQYAELTQVERPTVYNWLDEKVIPREVSLKRIQLLHHRAQLWASLCSSPPGSLLRSASIQGRNLLEWLGDEEATDPQLLEVMQEAKQLVEKREARLKRTASLATPQPGESSLDHLGPKVG